MTAYQHAFGPCYDPRMTTPILTAAAARLSRRNPRGVRGRGGKKTPHNFVAQAPKNKAGAPLGNRNAARRSPEYVERQARIDALVQQTAALVHAANAAADQGRMEHEILRALLAGGRHV